MPKKSSGILAAAEGGRGVEVQERTIKATLKHKSNFFMIPAFEVMSIH
jgi:hypothetical protein